MRLRRLLRHHLVLALPLLGPDNRNTAMPIGAPTPTEDERTRLGEWLACGAP